LPAIRKMRWQEGAGKGYPHENGGISKEHQGQFAPSIGWEGTPEGRGRKNLQP